MFCQNCGKGLPEGASFCPVCGFPVGREEETRQETALGEASLSEQVESARSESVRRIPMLLLIVLIALAVAGTAFAATYVYRHYVAPALGFPGAVEVIPETTGMSIDEAEALLEEKGYSVIRKGVVSQEDRGTVVSSEPEAGSSVQPGSSVTLIYSQLATVPDVVGMEESEARAAIESVGLVADCVYESAEVEPGTVASSSPAAGEALAFDDHVFLTVARRERKYDFDLMSIRVPAEWADRIVLTREYFNNRDSSNRDQGLSELVYLETGRCRIIDVYASYPIPDDGRWDGADLVGVARKGETVVEESCSFPDDESFWGSSEGITEEDVEMMRSINEVVMDWIEPKVTPTADHCEEQAVPADSGRQRERRAPRGEGIPTISVLVGDSYGIEPVKDESYSFVHLLEPDNTSEQDRLETINETLDDWALEAWGRRESVLGRDKQSWTTVPSYNYQQSITSLNDSWVAVLSRERWVDAAGTVGTRGTEMRCGIFSLEDGRRINPLELVDIPEHRLAALARTAIDRYFDEDPGIVAGPRWGMGGYQKTQYSTGESALSEQNEKLLAGEIDPDVFAVVDGWLVMCYTVTDSCVEPSCGRTLTSYYDGRADRCLFITPLDAESQSDHYCGEECRVEEYALEP